MTARFRTRACACTTCVQMCEHRPCWPTPAEAQRIIKAGLGGRLMLDYWVGTPTTDILAPAIVGREGKPAPFWPRGRCTFLTVDGKCELHALKLKPLEGRVAHHSMKDATAERVRRHIVRLWRGSQHVANEWRAR